MTPGPGPGPSTDLSRGLSRGCHPLVADERRAVHAGDWFSGLSRPLRDAILSRASVRCARHGKRVLRQGAPADMWLCVVAGSLRLCHLAFNGRQVAATLVPPGGWVGEAELCDGGPVLHDAYAQGDTRLLAIARADFRFLVQRDAEFAQALLRLQCARLRAMVEQVADLHTLSLEQRMAKQLLQLEHAFGVDPSRGPSIALRVSQSELGELVGASRQRTNGMLKQFEREGAVRVAPSGVQIVAREVLKARATAA